MIVGIVVDLILVAIIALNVFLGYKKGLIKVAFNFLAFFIAIIMTIILFKPISNLIIEKTQIDDNIEKGIIENFSSKNYENNETQESSNFIEKYINERIKTTATEAKDQAVESIAKTISIRLTEIITAIGLFVVIRILLILLRFLSDMLAELPIIKQCNEAGGIIYGLLKSVIIIYFILTIIFIVSSINGNGFVNNAIDESYITKFLYNNNVIVKYCFLDKNLI